MEKLFFVFWLPTAVGLLFSALSIADMVDSDDYEPWEVCALCHGYSGDSVMSKFPKLNGQKAEYLTKQIDDFKTGKRQNDGGQMSEMVLGLSKEEISDIVSWFAAQEPPISDEVVLEEHELKQAKNIVYQGSSEIPPCIQCHQEKNSRIPWLTGQHSDYLEKQLMDFKYEERSNDESVMTVIANKLTEDQISIVSNYLSSKKRGANEETKQRNASVADY